MYFEVMTSNLYWLLTSLSFWMSYCKSTRCLLPPLPVRPDDGGSKHL
jgi:hypothetical protein